MAQSPLVLQEQISEPRKVLPFVIGFRKSDMLSEKVITQLMSWISEGRPSKSSNDLSDPLGDLSTESLPILMGLSKGERLSFSEP